MEMKLARHRLNCGELWCDRYNNSAASSVALRSIGEAALALTRGDASQSWPRIAVPFSFTAPSHVSAGTYALRSEFLIRHVPGT
jgi:hypothetical protein